MFILLHSMDVAISVEILEASIKNDLRLKLEKQNISARRPPNFSPPTVAPITEHHTTFPSIHHHPQCRPPPPQEQPNQPPIPLETTP
jgi:hypothetical protein